MRMVSPTTPITKIILTNLNEKQQHENDDDKNDDDIDNNDDQQQNTKKEEVHDMDVTSERINCKSKDHHEIIQTKSQQESTIDSHDQLLEQQLLSLTINEDKLVVNDDDNNNQSDDAHHHDPIHLICDLSYGLPKEIRPRQEKLNAIAKQLINFVSWQQHEQHNNKKECCLPLGKITIITRSSSSSTTATSNTTIIQQLLLQRMNIIWKQQQQPDIEFPNDRIVFTNQTLEEIYRESNCYQDNIIDSKHHNNNSKPNENSQTHSSLSNFVYLSPDSPNTLDINYSPPRILIIGLLIDRKQIQYNRSYERAIQSSIPTARLPIDNIMMTSSDDDVNETNNSHRLHPNEPLNVDCILEVMQQWDWNCYKNMLLNQTETTSHNISGSDSINFNPNTTITNNNDNDYSKCYYDAFEQAMKHHCERHPGRPFHLYK